MIRMLLRSLRRGIVFSRYAQVARRFAAHGLFA
jgi:hypothetical protein